jgi:hypothetical protein
VPRFSSICTRSGLLALLLLVAGCGSTSRNVTIPVWQKNVEQYVQKEGKGDPTVLRDVTLSESRRGYGVIGSDRPEKSTDANGVLLGHRQIQGRNWFIYLVGLVKEQKVQEIRLAAMTTDGTHFEWKLGAADSEALHKYRAYNDRLWHQRFPQRGMAPPQYLGFPLPDDDFQLSVTETMITATHPASGARWTLNLASAPAARHARAD